MSGWRKCDRCRKVRTGAEFEGASSTCQACRRGPAEPARKRATPVTRIQAPAAPAALIAAVPSGPRRALQGAVGSGDLEVRERRARRLAADALSQAHPEEFAALLREARQAEGLRPLSTGPVGLPTAGAGPVGAGPDRAGPGPDSAGQGAPTPAAEGPG